MSEVGRHLGGMATTVATYGQPTFSVKEEVVVKQERRGSTSPRLPYPQQDHSPFLYSNTVIDSGRVESNQVSVPVGDLPISDMDLTGFLDMDDKTLSG